jgi:hypothetical protein
LFCFFITYIYIFQTTGVCGEHPCPGFQRPDKDQTCPSGCIIGKYDRPEDKKNSTFYSSLKYTLGISDLNDNNKSSSSSLENMANIYSLLADNTSPDISLPFSNEDGFSEEEKEKEKLCVLDKCLMHTKEDCITHTENICIPTEKGCGCVSCLIIFMMSGY